MTNYDEEIEQINARQAARDEAKVLAVQGAEEDYQRLAFLEGMKALEIVSAPGYLEERYQKKGNRDSIIEGVARLGRVYRGTIEQERRGNA